DEQVSETGDVRGNRFGIRIGNKCKSLILCHFFSIDYRVGENASKRSGSATPLIISATTSPVAGPRLKPSILWPVATKVADLPGILPMYGAPSGVIGRGATHSSNDCVQSTLAR